MRTSRSPQEAAQELLKRRSARKRLVEWARHKGFEPAKHHQLIISEIENFLESDDEVLLLFAPPGSAKSTYVSVLLPSWYPRQQSEPQHPCGVAAITDGPNDIETRITRRRRIQLARRPTM